MFDLALEAFIMYECYKGVGDSQVILLPGTCTNTTPLANELTEVLTIKIFSHKINNQMKAFMSGI